MAKWGKCEIASYAIDRYNLYTFTNQGAVILLRILDMAKSVFNAGIFERRKTIATLIEESRADADFYLFLAFAAFITTLGLHLNNAVVIIGAMLVAPILFPILSLGMGIVTSSADAITRSLRILAKSLIGVIIISFVTSFLINESGITDQMLLASNPNFLFFLAAFLSGIVASFSWTKQEVNQTLPGVAVTVSLIPPLATVGVALSVASRDLFAGSMLLFIINLLGVVLASILIFSLFGFASLQGWQEQKIKEEKKKEEEESTESVAPSEEVIAKEGGEKVKTDEMKEIEGEEYA